MNTFIPILAAQATSTFTGIDWLVIAAYFALLLGITWWSILKNRNTADDYFLAGRHLSWWVIGASIFASNIGSEHLVGLAGSGSTDGVAMAHYELHAWCLLVLAWVLVPFYMRSMVYTMPEFLERRFTPSARWVLSIISLVAYVLTKMAVGIFAGGVVFGTLIPELQLDLGFATLDSFWLGSIAVVLLTGLYTVLGGMRAVAYTEAVQTLILVLGSVLVTIFGLARLGGWDELRNTLNSDMFNLWKPLVPEGVEGTWEPVKETGRIAWYFSSNYPWLGMLFCAPIIGLWYWCTDQYIVQRTLSAPNEQQARRGTICAAFLKLLPVFIFIIPGMICFALATSGKVSEFGRMLLVEGGKVTGPDGKALGEGMSLASQGREVVVAGDKITIRGASVTEKDTGKVIAEGLETVTVEGGKALANREECQAAFPLMVAHVLPLGLRGIVVAGLLAALMSSLAGAFNASSTLFTIDLYQKFRPGASQSQLVWMGRVATTVMVVIGLLWIPVIQGAKGLYHYLQSVQGYLAPPIFVVFFLGVFMKRLNGKGCLAALIVGFILGVFRLAVDTPVMLKMEGYANGYAPGSFLWIINNIYFQYFSLLIFIVCVAVMIAVSYLTAPPSEEKIRGLTFATTSAEDRAKSRASWNKSDVLASVVVLVLILIAYLYFTG